MKKSRVFLAILVLLLIIYFFAPYWLNYLGKRLVIQDKLAKADIIIILGGDNNGERAEQGIALYRAGYAPKLLMSGGPLAWRLTYAEWMKKQVVESGIPAAAIILQDKSRSTIEDAKFTLPLLKQYNIKSVILVTSPMHTRRAKRVFTRLLKPANIGLIVYPAQKSGFNPDRWWTRHEDLSSVVWEYVSSVLYFVKGY
ncbi:MAG: YdcF family protein [Candidatus Margulisbacteria bacterium]|nr:YdcF family protein [Candidatus Margulisiibacteriota bacterium]